MDYNLRTLDNQINFLKLGPDARRDLLLLYQIRLEYQLLFLLGYLWNKNFAELEVGTKEYVIKKLERPTIGDVIELLRRLDTDREVFTSPQLSKSLNDYPRIRNKFIGHGYTLGDSVDTALSELKNINRDLCSADSSILSQPLDLVLVTSIENERAVGIKFHATDSSYSNWVSAITPLNRFEKGNLYSHSENYVYRRLSPFIHMEAGMHPKSYVYVGLEERLTGRIKYNSVFEGKQAYREWDSFADLSISIPATKKKSVNGTILNVFSSNFKEYIPLEIKGKVRNFLLNNRAFVSATIWGHGGIGKTATIQSLCNDLANERKRHFDYIIFLSAKDRRFNFESGQVEDLVSDEKVDKLDSIVQKVNQIIFGDSSTDDAQIRSFEGKVLLIIDDFETFPEQEKNRVIKFVKKLNTNVHKVVITTRAKISVGEEIATNELPEEDTVSFLRQVLPIEFGEKIDLETFDREFADAKRIKALYRITGGRPLFIFQFAHLYAAQTNGIDKLLHGDLKSGISAVRFLYERIYEYLNRDARRVFAVIGQLIQTKENLSQSLDRVAYVLEMEGDDDAFQEAAAELVKLKIIEVDEQGVFQIYSKEIWDIMLHHYKLLAASEKERWEVRLESVRLGKGSIEHALLNHANTVRNYGTDDEVTKAYRRILDRPTCPSDVRMHAVTNYAEYLFSDQPKRSAALRLLTEYSAAFAEEPEFVRMYALLLWQCVDIEDIASSKLNQKRSVQVLSDFLLKKSSSTDPRVQELLAIYLHSRSTLLIDELEQLETKRKLLEIKDASYQFQHQELMQSLHFLSKDGNKLHRHISRTVSQVVEQSSVWKTRVLNGLLGYIDVCERLGHHTQIRKVCLSVFDIFGDNQSDLFVEKLKRVYLGLGKPEELAIKEFRERVMKKKVSEKTSDTRPVRVIRLGRLERLPDGSLSRVRT